MAALLHRSREPTCSFNVVAASGLAFTLPPIAPRRLRFLSRLFVALACSALRPIHPYAAFVSRCVMSFVRFIRFKRTSTAAVTCQPRQLLHRYNSTNHAVVTASVFFYVVMVAIVVPAAIP